MSEAAAVIAESQSAPEMEVDRGPLVNLTGDQRAEFRRTGEIPQPKKSEEAATSSEPKPKAAAESAGDSETPLKTQEKPKKQTAEERIAQLEATIEKIRKGSGIKETPKAESSTAKPEPKPVADKEPTPEDLNQDGTPRFKTYEEYIKAQARWEARQEWVERERSKNEHEHADRFKSRMDEASSRHENFAEARDNFTSAMSSITINPAVRDMLNDSDVFPDLVAVIGGDQEQAAKFSKMAQDNPGKALRYIALTESLIAEELANKAKPNEEAPVKPKTQAPKPPSEAGGRAAAPPDALTAAIAGSSGKLTPEIKAEMTRRALAKLKG